MNKNRILAKPNANNFHNCRLFKCTGEAKKFLDEFTEFKMPVDDWIRIGKILDTNTVSKSVLCSLLLKTK